MNIKDIIKFNKQNVAAGKSKKGYGFTYFARNNFKAGDLIMMGFGKKIDHQTSHISVQINKNKHYLPTKWTGRYWNHSCDPNAFIKTRKDGFPNLIAKKNIKKGEEITYSYFMTELEWVKNADENFAKCQCGSKRCKKKIKSFKDLSQTEKNSLKKAKYCSQYLYTIS